MFQFRRFPTYAYLIQRRLTEYCSAGFPHSEIHGSRPMCGSPWLIAACHVLRRLLMPRHSPCALISLTSSAWTSYRSLPCKHESSLAPSRLLSESRPLRWVSIRQRAPRAVSSLYPSFWPSPVSKLVLKNYAGTNRCHCSFALPLFKKVHKKTLLPLCCLLAI